MESLLLIGLVNVALAALLAMAVLLVSRFLRRPALLHALWLLVLLKLLAPPLLPLPILPAVTEPVAAKPMPTPKLAVAPRFVEIVSPPNQFETLLVPPRDPLPAMMIVRILPQPDAVEDGVFTFEAAASEPSATELEITPSFPWRTVLVSVWFAGAVFSLAWTLWSLMAFQRLLRYAERAPDSLQDSAQRLARDMCLGRCPELWLLPGPLPPLIWAAFGRARLYFPRDLLSRLDEEGRATLMAHELAHVARRDHWVRWIELLAIAFTGGVHWSGGRERGCEPARNSAAMPGSSINFPRGLMPGPSSKRLTSWPRRR